MKKLIYFAIILLFPSVVFGANIYVSSSAGGSNNGTNWTHAYTSYSSGVSAAARGDTIYVADGSYTNVNLATAASGTTYIYIKKATASDHGIETGWSASLGDGTAEFNGQSQITTPYWHFTGQWRNVDTDDEHGSGTVYGFKIKQDGDYKCFRIVNTHHIIVEYTEMEHAGYSDSDLDNADCFYLIGSDSAPIHDITLQYCWLHNATRTAVWGWRIYDTKFIGNYFSEIYCDDAEGVHGEAFSINNSLNNGTMNTVANNVFRNIEGSGWFVWNNNFTSEHYDWEIYNNLFFVDGDHILDGWNSGGQPTVSDFTGSDGVVVVLNPSTIDNVRVYGNTFANMQQTNSVVLTRSGVTSTNTIARNNLFIRATGTSSWSANTTSNNESTSNTSIVADYANFDLRLVSATNDGYDLESPYNTDFLDVSRGGDATWDLGAYEYTGVDTIPPTLSTVTIGTNGTAWSFVYSEDVTATTTADLCDDYAVTMTNAGAITLSYSSGDGTNTVVCGGSPTVNVADTVSAGLDYTPGTIVDEAASPNSLASIDDNAVTNNSTQGSDTTPPEVSGNAVVGTDGVTVNITFTETVVTTGYDNGDFDLDCSVAGNGISLNSITGTGSTRSFTAATTIGSGDTCNLDYTGGADEIEDTAGNDLATFADGGVTNNSIQVTDTTPPEVGDLVFIYPNGTTWMFVYTEAVTADTTADLCDDFSITMNTAGAITFTYVSGDGTGYITCTGSPLVYGTDYATDGIDYTPGTIKDLSSNAMTSLNDWGISNGSQQVPVSTPNVMIGGGSYTIH